MADITRYVVMRRERPTEPHERNIRRRDLRPVPDWLPAAARDVDDLLRAFAARYPDRFEFRGGKLQAKKANLTGKPRP